MSRPVSLESIVLDLADREWRRRYRDGRVHGLAQSLPTLSRLAEQVCPMRSLMPALVELLRENHHRPMTELRPTIHRLIEERDYLDECGDPCVDRQQDWLIAQYVDLLVDVLERVRCYHLTHGEWSNAPVTPLMHG
jgi:hypothetical protein